MKCSTCLHKGRNKRTFKRCNDCRDGIVCGFEDRRCDKCLNYNEGQCCMFDCLEFDLFHPAEGVGGLELLEERNYFKQFLWAFRYK